MAEHRCAHLVPHCPGRCPISAPPYEALRGRLLEEQANLWADLDHAVRRAHVDPPVIPGRWSIECDGLARRIIDIAALVGPVGWEHIQVDLLLQGIYEEVLRAGGLTWPPIDWDEVRAVYGRNRAAVGLTWAGPPVDLLGSHPGWVPL